MGGEGDLVHQVGGAHAGMKWKHEFPLEEVMREEAKEQNSPIVCIPQLTRRRSITLQPTDLIPSSKRLRLVIRVRYTTKRRGCVYTQNVGFPKCHLDHATRRLGTLVMPPPHRARRRTQNPALPINLRRSLRRATMLGHLSKIRKPAGNHFALLKRTTQP